MSQEIDFDVERAWKNEEYRKSLTQDQLNLLPPNPAGDGTMQEEELDSVSGGRPRLSTTMDCYKFRTTIQGG